MLTVCVGLRAGAQTADSPTQIAAQARELLLAGVRSGRDASLQQAVALFETALAANPQFATAELGRAEALLWLGDYDGARAGVEAARATGGDPVHAARIEAEIAAREGEFERAIAAYRSILAERPNDREALIGLALLDVRTGITPGRFTALAALTERYPDDRRLLVALTELASIIGDADAAGRYLRAALQYHSDSASVQMRALNHALVANDPMAALFHGENATRIAPELPDAWRALLRAARAAGDDDIAAASADRIVELRPRDPTAWYLRGEVAAERGDAETAGASWQRALRLDPEYELPRLAWEGFLLATAPIGDERRREAASGYLEEGQRLERRYLNLRAERAYRRGLLLDPQSADLRYALADLFFARGWTARGREELRILEVQAPGFVDDDLIGVIDSQLRDSVSRQWEVDQFVIPRDRHDVIVVGSEPFDVDEPGVTRHLATYVVDLANSTQHVEAISVSSDSGTLRSLVEEGRARGADRVVGLTVASTPERIRASVLLVDPSTGRLLRRADFIRTGNGRLTLVATDVAAWIAAETPIRGRVVDRDIDRLLVSLGQLDGIEVDTRLQVISERTGEAIGAVTIEEIDDVVSAGRWEPVGADRLRIGDGVVLEPPADAPRDPELVATGVPVPTVTPSLGPFLRDIFQLR